MNFKKWKIIVYYLAILGTVQSYIIPVIAMIFYTGGTDSNHLSPGYSFWENLLSDLGRIYAYSGQLNIISSTLYNISLFMMGAFLVPYFLVVPSYFKGLKEARWFSIAGSIGGIFLCTMLIGASVTPADLLIDIHLMFGMLAFFVGLPVSILFAFAIFLNKNFPNLYAIIYALFGIILFIFILTMFQDVGSPVITPTFAIGQKIIVYTLITNFLIQAYGAILQEKKKDI